MLKRFKLYCMLMSLILLLFSQKGFSGAVGVTNAVDFTANDLSGNTHHLFSYLDSGKYVGLGFCANPMG